MEKYVSEIFNEIQPPFCIATEDERERLTASWKFNYNLSSYTLTITRVINSKNVLIILYDYFNKKIISASGKQVDPFDFAKYTKELIVGYRDESHTIRRDVYRTKSISHGVTGSDYLNQHMRAVKSNDEKEVRNQFMQALRGVRNTGELLDLKCALKSSTSKSPEASSFKFMDDFVEKETGNTPLIAACIRKNKWIAQSLIYTGANVNQQNRRGETPLSFVCENESVDILKMLLEHHVKTDSLKPHLKARMEDMLALDRERLKEQLKMLTLDMVNAIKPPFNLVEMDENGIRAVFQASFVEGRLHVKIMSPCGGNSCVTDWTYSCYAICGENKHWIISGIKVEKEGYDMEYYFPLERCYELVDCGLVESERDCFGMCKNWCRLPLSFFDTFGLDSEHKSIPKNVLQKMKTALRKNRNLSTYGLRSVFIEALSGVD